MLTIVATPWAAIVNSLMKEKNISQRKLGIETGVNRATLRRWLEGATDIRILQLELILAYLGYEMDIFKSEAS